MVNPTATFRFKGRRRLGQHVEAFSVGQICFGVPEIEKMILPGGRNCGEPLGRTVYGLRVLTPGEFLRIEREGAKLP